MTLFRIDTLIDPSQQVYPICLPKNNTEPDLSTSVCYTMGWRGVISVNSVINVNWATYSPRTFKYHGWY